jgi:hypothetical protein
VARFLTLTNGCRHKDTRRKTVKSNPATRPKTGQLCQKSKIEKAMKSGIKDLSLKLAECVHACNACHEGCLNEKMVAMMAECIRLDKDCAVVCAATLQLVHAGGRFARKALELCIEACEACGKECAKHDYDHCRECARVCGECAKACRDFTAGL